MDGGRIKMGSSTRCFQAIAVAGLLALTSAAQTSLAQTEYPTPPPPPTDAERVDWATANFPDNGTDRRSNFIRAQSLLAQLAAAAYDSEAAFQSAMEPRGFVGELHTKAGAAAYLGLNESATMAFIALRGTNNLDDVLNDLTLAPDLVNDGVPGQVHLGFSSYAAAAYEAMQPDIDGLCIVATGLKIPVWVTGHSLGGAAATILAYRLADSGCPIAGVATFGSPRPGLGNFQRGYDARLGLLTNRWGVEDDPVVCMPPGGGWYHVGFGHTLESSSISLNTTDGCGFGINSTISQLRTVLAAIAPTDILLLPAGQAILDWLRGVFDFVLDCPAWVDVISLGQCSLNTLGLDLAAVYNGLTPEEFLFSLGTAALFASNHNRNKYTSRLAADFTDPPVQWVTVRVLFPSYVTTEFQEAVYQGTCRPQQLNSLDAYCDFQAAVGYPLSIRSTARLVPAAGSPCTQDPDRGLRCDINTVTGATTIELHTELE